MNESTPTPMVNWDAAAKAAAKLAPAGPKLTTAEVVVLAEDLRERAERSVDIVYELTGLEAAKDLNDSHVLIVDRAGWAKANTQSFAVLSEPIVADLISNLTRPQSKGMNKLTTAIAGSQMGVIMAYLASKVLGQYEPFVATAAGGGRLLLVAPNIVEVERELGVNTEDFRLWVCIHEQTHRVQFAAAPWLKTHMLEQISALSDGLAANATTWPQKLTRGAKDIRNEISAPEKSLAPKKESAPNEPAPQAKSSGGPALLDLFTSAEDQARLSHLIAGMSLLEGHATVVMDAVDASTIPTVKTIRQRFNARSQSRSGIQALLRKLLGLEAKAKQYVAGAKFVRAVIEQSDMAFFNRIWERPENLPSEAEIEQPSRWVERMRVKLDAAKNPGSATTLATGVGSELHPASEGQPRP